MTKRDERKMKPLELQLIREGLGMTRIQFGALLGFEGNSIAQSVQRLENGSRVITPTQAMVAWAYAGGWRPSIWPRDIATAELDASRIERGQARIALTLRNGRDAMAAR